MSNFLYVFVVFSFDLNLKKSIKEEIFLLGLTFIKITLKNLNI